MSQDKVAPTHVYSHTKSRDSSGTWKVGGGEKNILKVSHIHFSDKGLAGH